MTAPSHSSQLIERIRCAIADARQATSRFVAVGVPCEPGWSSRLIDARLSEFDCFWSEPAPKGHARTSWVGIGWAIRHRFEGEDRFRQAEQQLARSFSEVAIPEELKQTVRFLGGAAFSHGRDGSGSCWSTFGDASFFLPRVIYQDSGDSARLVVLVERGVSTRGLLGLVERIVEAGAGEAPPTSDLPLFSVAEKTSADQVLWRELMDGIQQRIDAGGAQKIVLARRLTVQLSRRPNVAGVLARLQGISPACTHFALRISEKTFVGATPECLVKKSGLALESEALAGSIAAAVPDAAERLMHSAKDRDEHEFVVRALRDALGALCSDLECGLQPELLRLKKILHLRTPVRGTLRDDTHVLRLVEQLHPTPAVGGVPRREAVDFIDSHEPTERGWYAAPFGWVDTMGNGHFMVALRSALVHRDKVHVYAGAGIVRQSDAAQEFAETELKLGSMLGALGVGR